MLLFLIVLKCQMLPKVSGCILPSEGRLGFIECYILELKLASCQKRLAACSAKIEAAGEVLQKGKEEISSVTWGNMH